ncbi:type I-E CRISPR-associated protein Cse2/CasB, partial [Halomonas sp.]|uniref:type I-E CRISPR-associated protein Cse2/CasB n=1 Tax=Halomonas sp. TaxID=1486246 RepID=UPI00299C999B|nr:hypothetical protein [Halomonas sp.]
MEFAPETEAASRVPERPYCIRREADALRRWWQRLTLSREVLKAHTDAPPWPKGMRAALRRCDTLEAAMLTEAFRHLWQQLPADEGEPEWRRDQRLQ